MAESSSEPVAAEVAPALACSKCNGPMAQGFFVDATHGGRLVLHWGAGAPETSFWQGTKKPALMLPVGVFRCERCGYLECYAHGSFAAR